MVIPFISSKDSKVTSAVPKSTTFTLRVEKLRRVHCFFSFLVGKTGISDKEEKPCPVSQDFHLSGSCRT